MSAEHVIEVTVKPLAGGGEETARLPAGTYLVICTEPAHVAFEQAFANGTVQITLKETSGPKL